MQVSSRFTIAIHLFACIDTFRDTHKLTSDFIADSVNVNPVIIRKLLQQLKAAGLVRVARGTGGVTEARPLDQITLYDVFYAVDSLEHGELFHFHENPNANCPVGRSIHPALDAHLKAVQTAMDRALAAVTLADVMRDVHRCIAAEESGAAPLAENE